MRYRLGPALIARVQTLICTATFGNVFPVVRCGREAYDMIQDLFARNPKISFYDERSDRLWMGATFIPDDSLRPLQLMTECKEGIVATIL